MNISRCGLYYACNGRLDSLHPILNPTVEHVNVLAYMTGDLFDMPAGAVGAVFGVEFRQDEMELQANDGANYGGITYNIVPDIKGDMDVAELFTELSFPLADKLTADVALRLRTTVTRTSTRYSVTTPA